jgi:hypothetical protein
MCRMRDIYDNKSLSSADGFAKQRGAGEGRMRTDKS